MTQFQILKHLSFSSLRAERSGAWQSHGIASSLHSSQWRWSWVL